MTDLRYGESAHSTEVLSAHTIGRQIDFRQAMEARRSDGRGGSGVKATPYALHRRRDRSTGSRIAALASNKPNNNPNAKNNRAATLREPIRKEASERCYTYREPISKEASERCYT